MFKAALSLMFAASFLPVSLEAVEAKEVPATVQDVFIPYGFDSNDNLELTLRIKYHNTCYKQGSIKTSIDVENKTLNINATSIYEAHNQCGLMLTFGTEVVAFGSVPPGEYNVLINGSPLHETPDLVHVAKATNDGPDDYSYLPLSDMRLDDDGRTLILEGYYQVNEESNQCFELNEMVLINQEKVLVILPKGKFVDCESDESVHKLYYEVDTKGYLATPKLIHVRTSNGKSLNKIVPFFFF